MICLMDIIDIMQYFMCLLYQDLIASRLEQYFMQNKPRNELHNIWWCIPWSAYWIFVIIATASITINVIHNIGVNSVFKSVACFVEKCPNKNIQMAYYDE